MSLLAVHPESLFSSRLPQHKGAWSPSKLRVLLVVGCLASVAAAGWLGQPSAYLRANPEAAMNPSEAPQRYTSTRLIPGARP